MISIQDLGLSIMSETPKSLYIVGGQEYGIKDKYIDHLTRFYGKKEEYPSVEQVVDFLSVKHIVPIEPSLYVVRYDEGFVSSISPALTQKINRMKIKGTIFCVYSEKKSIDKLDKFFPNNVCVIEAVNPKFIEKYLHSDFPDLDDRSIQVATKCSTSYGHARTICKSLMCADKEVIASMTDAQLATLFGCTDTSVEEDIQRAVAGRNFNLASHLLDSYNGNMDNLVYTILQTMIDMEKILTSKYSDSHLKEYAKLWKLEDIYHMFMNAYAELEKLRSNTSTDIKSSLIYLFGLFTFKDIPSVEVMNSGI